MNSTDSQKEKKWVKRILAILVAALLIYALFRFRAVVLWVLILPYIAYKLNEAGFEQNLAYALAVPITLLIGYVVYLLKAHDPKKKKQAYILASCLAIVWFWGIYWVQKDQFYDPKTGNAKKCFAATPTGNEEVRCDWQVHPTYGTPVFPATSEIAISKMMTQNGYPRVQKVNPTLDMAFFSPAGQPLVWYYQGNDGHIELFSYPGNHPQYNVPLAPINKEAAEKIIKQLEEKQAVKISAYSQEQNTGQPSQLKSLKDLSDYLKSLNK